MLEPAHRAYLVGCCVQCVPNASPPCCMQCVWLVQLAHRVQHLLVPLRGFCCIAAGAGMACMLQLEPCWIISCVGAGEGQTGAGLVWRGASCSVLLMPTPVLQARVQPTLGLQHKPQSGASVHCIWQQGQHGEYIAPSAAPDWSCTLAPVLPDPACRPCQRSSGFDTPRMD